MSSTFYGNMVNLLNAQFQFDREYSNYKELKDNTIADGVYIGRHSLVRYEKELSSDTLNKYTNIWDEVTQVDPKTFPTYTGLIAYLLQYNIDLYNLTPDKDKTITIPICKYDTKIDYSADVIIATIGKNTYSEKIYIAAKEGISFTDYSDIYFVDTVGGYPNITAKDTEGNETVILDNIYPSDKTGTINKDICARMTISYISIPQGAVDGEVIYSYSYYDSDDNLVKKINDTTLKKGLGLNAISYSDYTFNFKFVSSGKVEKVSNVNNYLVCDNNYSYYLPMEKIFPDTYTTCWWAGYIADDYYTTSDLQFYNLDEKDSEYKLNKFYKRADNVIYQSAITSSGYQKNFKYYLEIPFAHFKVIDSTDSFEVNKLIDNYYFGIDNLVDFENELDYDLTVWKKQFINSLESYKEVTGFKLPNMNYNLVKNGVLAVDEDNKIKGKELRGLGKLGVTYQNDTIDISHERSRLNTRILGDFNTATGEIRDLSFPVPATEVEFGYGLYDEAKKAAEKLAKLSDYDDYYQTTITPIEPQPTEDSDDHWSLWIVALDSDGNIDEKTPTNEENAVQYLEDGKINFSEYESDKSAELGKTVKVVALQMDSVVTETETYTIDSTIIYKISDSGTGSDYVKDDNGQWVLYKIDFNKVKQAWKVYYDPSWADAATYFQLPSFTIDEYGHIISDNNVMCRLPALEGDKFTVEFSNLDANYAKTAGVAYGIAPSINFKIGNTSRNSNSYLTTGIDKDKTYTWTLEDLGLEIGEGEQGKTRYPVASNLKNITSVTIGNVTKTATLGKDNLSFTLNEIGAIPLSGNTSDSDLLINGTQATIAAKDGNWEGNSEGIVFNDAVSADKSFKIGDVFKATPNGTEATFNKIILTEESYGIDLPTDPTEGQLFFKLEDASLEGGI